MSLNQVAGGPSAAAIRQTQTAAQAANGVSGKYAQTKDPGTARSNEFPIVPFLPDAYDTTAQLKSLAGDRKGFGENWVVPFTEQDAEYLIRQRNQAENADFDRWVMEKFDLGDPAQLFLFQQIAPEQFQRRKDLIDYEQNLVSKYAKMRLYGPKNIDDLKFEWLVETGRIELPAGPIWDPKTWMTNQLDGGSYHGRYMSGLFSPLNYLSDEQVGWQPVNGNKADIRGDPNRATAGQLFTGKGQLPTAYERYGSNPILKAANAAYDPIRKYVRFNGVTNQQDNDNP